jgi:hypothetical protein
MPTKILPEYRDEVTHYLIHGVSATAVEETKAAQKFVDPKVNQLIPIVQRYKSQGHKDDQILSLLIKSGVRGYLKKSDRDDKMNNLRILTLNIIL